MHSESTEACNASAELTAFFNSPAYFESAYGHASNLAITDYSGCGDFAWLRSEEAYESDEARWTITDAGRRALRMSDVFDPCPTVADVTRS